MDLFKLPLEILINIYCNLSHIHEAINLAQTCSAAHEVLQRPLSKRHILQSIISKNTSGNINEMNLTVLSFLHNTTLLGNMPRGENLRSASLSIFLSQFDGIESLDIIDTVIIKSASYQRKLIKGVESAMIGRRTIIARSLHCLIVVSQIYHALSQKLRELAAGMDPDEELETDEALLQALKDAGREPLPDGNSVSIHLRQIFEDLEEMIRRGAPSDWPIILTVLCISNWMWSEFGRDDHDLGDLTLIDSKLAYPLSELGDSLNTLCKMFYIQIRGNHPLRMSWDHNAYAKLVQGDALARAQFVFFNKAWCIASCDDSITCELDLDDNSYQRVEDSEYDFGSIEDKLKGGMAGWMESFDVFCHGWDSFWEHYPQHVTAIELWNLKPLDMDCLT